MTCGTPCSKAFAGYDSGMDKSNKPLIVLTNDDGIRSPGLVAAAHALAPLGRVLVVAPREQLSGSGRSMPSDADLKIDTIQMIIDGENWEVFAVGGSPAQAVQHAVFVLSEGLPDLVVAGINYGENVGNGVTISGTVGAALEAASFGIPSLAVSLETDLSDHHSYSEEVDFSASLHFTRLFAELLLTVPCPHDVDVLKVDVPMNADSTSMWQVTRQSRQNYWMPVNIRETEGIKLRKHIDYETLEPDSDIAAISELGIVSVTPISIDLTSRVSLPYLEKQLRAD